MEANIYEWTDKIKEANNNIVKKFAIMTMGCQLNENDSEKLCGIVHSAGYEK